MTRAMLLGYYQLMALLVFLNTRVEARLGISRATRTMEALLACAIVLPLAIPLFFNAINVFGLLR